MAWHLKPSRVFKGCFVFVQTCCKEGKLLFCLGLNTCIQSQACMLRFWRVKGTKAFSLWQRAPYEEIVNFYRSISRAPRQWQGATEAIASVASVKYQACNPPVHYWWYSFIGRYLINITLLHSIVRLRLLVDQPYKSLQSSYSCDWCWCWIFNTTLNSKHCIQGSLWLPPSKEVISFVSFITRSANVYYFLSNNRNYLIYTECAKWCVHGVHC